MTMKARLRGNPRRARVELCRTLKTLRTKKKVPPEMMRLFLMGRSKCPGYECGGAHEIGPQTDRASRCGCTGRSKSKSKPKKAKKPSCKPSPGLIKKLMKMLFKKKKNHCKKRKPKKRRSCKPKRRPKPKC